MMVFEGRWRAISRQATFGETPVRDVAPGSIADLIIEPNGKGHTFKRGMFGREKELPFTWVRIGEAIIHLDLGGGFSILATWMPKSGLLLTGWISPMKSVDGMAVLYEKV